MFLFTNKNMFLLTLIILIYSFISKLIHKAIQKLFNLF